MDVGNYICIIGDEELSFLFAKIIDFEEDWLITGLQYDPYDRFIEFKADPINSLGYDIRKSDIYIDKNNAYKKMFSYILDDE